MQIHFYKYQGTGNDFIILDNRKSEFHFSKEQISFLCDRRFGIGADGLILLNTHEKYDFEMKYYNADGGESSMCGNGGRCLAKFANDMGMTKEVYRFLAVDGEHEARVDNDGIIALKMNDVSGIRQTHGRFILNTGSPHYIEQVESVAALDVFHRGRQVRYSKEFETEGINVNFVEQTEEGDKIIVRTYERGVEDETYSCGTGVTAAALVYHHNDNGFNHVDVQTKGGNLSVEFDKVGNNYTNVWLIGPAIKVFEGEMEISDL